MYLHSATYKWQTQKFPGAELHYRGYADILIENLKAGDLPRDKTAYQAVKNFSAINNRYASAILETPDDIVAYVDHIRTWPIFYTNANGSFAIGPDAQTIKNHAGALNISSDATIEFAMSGYVSGNRTLHADIECLQPGQILIYNKQDGTVTIERYYQYQPDLSRSDIDERHAIDQLDNIIDVIIKDIIDRAGAHPIWLPLSGGLDSRLIACKLHQHGAKNVHTFSYGPTGNFESLIARKVAKKLGYPWQSVTIPGSTQRAYFNSEERKKFWNFAAGLKTIPCMREYSAIRYLHENSIMPQNAIIINGQSGDYISGGHINEFWLKNRNGTADDFFRLILNKHYNLWNNLKNPQNTALMKRCITALLPGQSIPDSADNLTMAARSETWEYDGRQITYVVNGQRIYEFLGYDWEMPLWDKALVDYYETIPIEMKFDQNLWKHWLKRWNYMGLFPQKEPYIWRWPLPMLWVVPVANILKIFAGDKFKKKFYDLMKYFGHYNNQYQYFPFSEHRKVYENSRNVIAMLVRSFIKENPSWFGEDLKKELKL